MGGIRDLVLSTAVGFATALVLGWILVPLLRSLHFERGGGLMQKAAEETEGAESTGRRSVPLLGGLLPLGAMVTGVLLCGGEGMSASLPCLLFSLGFGVIGLLDDGLQVQRKNGEGLLPWQKRILEIAVSLGAATYLYVSTKGSITLPFSGREWDMGFLYLPFALLALMATLHGVQHTHEPEGLAGGMACLILGTLGLLFGIMASGATLDTWGAKAAEQRGMAAFCGGAAGGCLGLLLFNMPPSRILLGNTGLMLLGGAIAMAALTSGQSMLLLFLGAGYWVSLLSMLIQWLYGKLKGGKPFFRAVPFHRHLKERGVPEGKITAGYLILTAVGGILALLVYLI